MIPFKLRHSAAVVLLLWPLGAAAADAVPNCAGIRAHSERLECQTKRRRSYGEGLERKLSGGGQQTRVFVEEAGDQSTGGFPRLIVFDHLTRDRIDSLNAQAGIVDGAREVGFKTLVYVDRGETSNWYFDLTRPGSAPLDYVPPKLPWLRRDGER